jgi:hypothetical protein
MAYSFGIIKRASDRGIGRMARVALTVPVTLPGYSDAKGLGWEWEMHSSASDGENKTAAASKFL